MKLAQKTRGIRKTFAVLAGLSMVCAAAPGANAKHNGGNSPAPPATVIAHLSLPGASVSQLILNSQGSKRYLYLAQGSKEGLAVVDVTVPSHPTVVKRTTSPNDSAAQELRMIGPSLALADAQTDAAPDPAPRSSTVMLLDLSDPASPRTLQIFSCVTSTVTDGPRGLTYIADRDGLWILRSAEPTATAQPRACASDDSSNEVASCQ